MNERLDQFMKAEGLTSAKLAEILSVQPSSISHLLSGRNNPNFDFISKMLLMFPRLNPHWIINGRGDIYLDDTKPKEDLTSTENYNSNPTDISTEKSTEISSQIVDKQTIQSVNSVMPLPDLFAQNASKEVRAQFEAVGDQPKIANHTDVINSQSVDNDDILKSKVRAVERVLLLYSDNTFEFFNR